MPVKEEIDRLEDVRDTLIRQSPKEPEAQHSGYINGVLDFYNAMKKFEEDKEEDKR